jgi:hypothetical protein
MKYANHAYNLPKTDSNAFITKVVVLVAGERNWKTIARKVNGRR